MQTANSSKTEPVIFRFKNLGPIEEAELELGDLTIIAGRNNTGKTYLAYTLYGFLKMWEEIAQRRNEAPLHVEIENLVRKAAVEGQARGRLSVMRLSRSAKR